MSTPSTSGRGGRRAAISPGPFRAGLLLACASLTVLVAALPIPLAPALGAEFGTAGGLAVVLPPMILVPTLLTAVLSPVAGRLIDSYGRKRLLVGALVLFGISGVLPMWLDTATAIVLSRIPLGIANALIMTSSLTLLGDSYRGPERNRMFGLQIVVATATTCVLPVLVGILRDAQSWRLPFVIHAVAVVLAVLVALAVRERHRLTAAGARRLPPLNRGRLALQCGATVVGSLVFYGHVAQFSVRLADVGVTAPSTFVALNVVAGAGAVTGAVLSGWLAARGPRRLLPAGFGLGGAGIVVLGLGGTVPVLVVGAVIASVGGGLLLPTLLTWVIGSLNLEQRGRSIGWWQGTLSLGTALLLVLAGVAGSSRVLVVVGATALLVAAVMARAATYQTGAHRARAGSPAEATALERPPAHTDGPRMDG